MKLGAVLAIAAALTMAAVCVRLGLWQASRWREKRDLNAAVEAATRQPPLVLRSAAAPPAGAAGRRLAARGRYDESRHVLLSARSHRGSPGVHVVTPLLLEDSTAVLVDRGWLPAADAASARPQDHPEPGTVTVVGLVEPLRRGSGGAPLRTLAAESPALYSARWLDADSLAGRFPYALAPLVIRQLPGPGVPDRPRRRAAEPANSSMHASYAAQWFLFAAILLIGPVFLVRSRRARPAPAGAPQSAGGRRESGARP